MNSISQSVPPIELGGIGMLLADTVLGPAGSGKMPRRRRRQRSDPALEIPGTVISDAALRRLIDESIVPALVEKFLQDKHSSPTEKSHNGQQP